MGNHKKDDDKKNLHQWVKILIIVLVLVLVTGIVYLLTRGPRKEALMVSKFMDEPIYWRR
jgi:flagellar biosynthesis protein FliP